VKPPRWSKRSLLNTGASGLDKPFFLW